jgi:2-polyprenyl-6-methoxyphenol hydroxylase-like FAD-dependent oxidoreductase
MIALPQHTNVLIVGAGPSGLMMAAQLLRYGVQLVIIDSKKGPTNESKAMAVQARSLEIYRQMGLVDKVLSDGKPAYGFEFNEGGKPVASLSLNNIGDVQTLYPFIHMYPQSKNERLLLDYLTLNCCPVYWETTLSAFTQNKDNITVSLESGGVQQALTSDWVIGADGTHSTTRKQLNISFSGDTYKHRFYLADLKLDANVDDNLLHLFLSSKGFAAFFPMPEANAFRIVGSLPEGLDDKDELQLEDILPHLKSVTSSSFNVIANKWFTTYKLHHRMAAQFSNQRCFLIGDAAHIHSPVGGQGMNTGLQDAYNLAWKLAAVINGQMRPNLLNSYAAERMPVAKDLLNTTDKAFKFITSKSWISGVLKKFVLPKMLNLLWGNQNMRTTFFKRISQTGIHYRDSHINLQLGQATKIRAGDRLPYLNIFDEKKQEQTDIHTWCNKPGFTLITLGEIKESYLFTLAKWITQKYNSSLNFFHLPPSANNQQVFDAFEVRHNTRKALIIRPDMYIGYINDVVDIELMDNYLLNVAGFIKQI